MHQNPTSPLSTPPAPDRTDALGLHWGHWLILLGSLTITVALYLRSSQADATGQAIAFERESERVVDLILDRMALYENALWAGAAHLQASPNASTLNAWSRYAAKLSIEGRYPGVNGIGLVELVAREDLPQYLARHRIHRPEFSVYPPHDHPEHLVISYIEPSELNSQAVGLDIAHESNRRAGALRARDTGTATITGPIVLVQDSDQTPGFLFYVPWVDAQERFLGLVYAPFVMTRLMHGTLESQRRLVHLRVRDGGEVLYDELVPSHPLHDPDPSMSEQTVLEMYGRRWTIDIQTDLAFRSAHHSSTPRLILAAGLLIDGILLWFFLALARKNREAITYASEVTERLEAVNEELVQFNYRTSHDLVAPLKTMRGFAALCLEDIANHDTSQLPDWLAHIDQQAARLVALVSDLLDLSRADRPNERPEPIALAPLLDAAWAGLATARSGHSPELKTEIDLPGTPMLEPTRTQQIVENILSNAVRYHDPDQPHPWVRVRAHKHQDQLVLIFEDNGLGIPEKIRETMFEMFVRGNSSQPGSGLGLYLVAKHLQRMSGRIEATSREGVTRFTITLPWRDAP